MIERFNGIDYQTIPMAQGASLLHCEIKEDTLSLLDSAGNSLTSLTFTYTNNTWCATFSLTDNEHFYGLGDGFNLRMQLHY